ncbi:MULTISPECIES: alpha/beta hydrolase [Carnobacterium]|uniref:alpha/beta hydrolase n=1 Tax=Carnobacterium TaxID=2747 RepID=UPI00288E8BDD|nr:MULTISPECIES: alpha/beta hydrolase [Carnobacterium]MDT1940266.1 alpha/beta hydrolase [Carnobacterium divergens]MDT1942704.1 alpha/beta hydrolase [Carnobacterium divergens]MDT1948510.1 alpha/beta hydrolase [Carnobacterium divergens]MDT1950991.1 alpha/beta hydrolase [Carnobacterium divergens]MDT1955821.1 alpha/beta hydrolase [Carnobacterium divergens]
MEKKKRRIGYVAPFLIGVLMAPAIITRLTPVPVSKLLRKRFERPKEFTPRNHEEIQAKTTSVNDIDYHSTLANGKMDVIMPKESLEKSPLIIWVHGGAYVGGDKRDITSYAESIASYGYVVANINYALAPEQIYPGPLVQLTESYLYLKEHAEEFGIDLDQVLFAGDSAGAQIVAQFLAIQTNPILAELVAIQAVVPKESIKGGLLFCGPFNIEKLGTESKSRLMNILMNQVAWAYVGEKNWLKDERLKQVALDLHITKEYPPVFVTDGNTNSFEHHAHEFIEQLKAKQIEVESVFFDPKEAKTEHEYQFLLNTEPAKITFNKMMEFIEKHVS